MAKPLEGTHPQGGRLAFVLDDEIDVREFVCEVLTANGFLARQFSEPAPLFAETALTPPDLIVLDLALGRSDAVEVIRQLEALRFKGNVLLISGHDASTLAEIEQIGRSRRLAMLAPLQKPFRAAELKARLAAVAVLGDALTELRFTGKADAGAAKKKMIVDPEEAHRKGWLELWYQPKIDLRSLAVCGAEALLRARHPEHGIVLPADLLPPSGDALYRPLSRFVIERALADWQALARQEMPLKLAVNIPASVIHAPDFIDVVRDLLPRDPKFPGLILEITEDEAIRDAEWVHEIATQLKLYNTWISIDDFGAAYSSLSRLLDLPCVELKLDRSFVSNCAADKLKTALCQAVIDLAHRFGAVVCAEGVETAQDLRTLIDMGCDSAQGFLFARPMARDTFAATILALGPGSRMVPPAVLVGRERGPALAAPSRR